MVDRLKWVVRITAAKAASLDTMGGEQIGV
jgi:hypothetical protein